MKIFQRRRQTITMILSFLREATYSYTIDASLIFGSLKNYPSFHRQSRSNLDVDSKAPLLPERNEESDKTSATQSFWSHKGSFANEVPLEVMDAVSLKPFSMRLMLWLEL